MSEEDLREELRDPSIRADEAVTEWLTYVNSGRTDRAWRLLTTQAREHAGGYSGFVEWMKDPPSLHSELVEPPNATHESVVVIPGGRSDGSLVLVTLVRDKAALAIPVFVHPEGVARVQPFSTRTVSLTRPAGPNDDLSCRPLFEAVVEGTRPQAAHFSVFVGGGEVESFEIEELAEDRYQVAARIPHELSEGITAVSVLTIGPESMEADASVFRVEY
ncbi:MAG: hypothetical protein M3280_01775 [Actinomycetota bacterium]|nr:hypothetical protein [Actinomycetota bacterium]